KWPSIWLLPSLLKKRIRFVFWGIGLSTEQGLGVDSRFDIPRFLIARLANGLLFYSNCPLSKYENFGISISSMFVAHNTVYVESKVFPPPSMNKAYILFFGSLTSRKGIPLLIDAFVKAYQHFSRKEIKLLIVGDGPERNFLENIINSDSLHRLVELRHGVYSFQDKID